MEVRVRCLDLGADDVVLKPFSFRELRARMKALCRRRRRSEDAVLRFGDVEMDRAEHRVMRSGCKMELTATEFSLLESLLRRQGERVCSRLELLREVWRAPEAMGTNVFEVYINYLRRKLGQTRLHGSGLECVIQTVRGEGYLLAGGGLARGALDRLGAARSEAMLH
jgi:DNA-binding response OmpR family regulator